MLIIAYRTSSLAVCAKENCLIRRHTRPALIVGTPAVWVAGSHKTEAQQLVALFHTVPQPTAHDGDIFCRACGVGAWEAIAVTSPPVSVKRLTTVAAQLPKPIPALP